MSAGARVLLVLACALLHSSLCAVPLLAQSKNTARPTGTTVLDDIQRVDINNISMVVKNTGSFAYDTQTGSSGLEFPKGSGKTAVFASGLWLGAMRGGSARVSIAEYSDDYRPGAVIGGQPADPTGADFRVFKLSRRYDNGSGGIDAVARDAALADYWAHAVPYGAPQVFVEPSGLLSTLGDQMLWSVFNDLRKTNHSRASSALPLGVEVQQTTWAYDRPQVLGNTVLIRYKLINRSNQDLTDMYLGFWSDVDLGGASDDLTGCDTTRRIGFTYNATNADQQYGASPPVVGLDLLQGPYSTALSHRLPATAFISYVNGGGPQDSTEVYDNLMGLDALGNTILDPGSNPTRFMFSGDPITSTGWLDANPSDRRMILASGPITMKPGVPQEVVLAVLLARGSDRLSSLAKLRSDDSDLRVAFDSGNLDLLPVPRDPRGSNLALAAPFPQPARGAVSLTVTLPSDGEAMLELLDVMGRRVIARSLGPLPAGSHTIPIDLSRRAPGLYFVRVTHHDATVSQRLVVVE